MAAQEQNIDSFADAIAAAKIQFEEALAAYAAASDSIRVYSRDEIAFMERHRDETEKRLHALTALRSAAH